MTDLFQRGDFTLHSGARSDWKIECDALSDEEISLLADLLYKRIPYRFSKVVGVPQGGLRLAAAMERYIDSTMAKDDMSRTLVVDDVYTTGTSLAEYIEANLKEEHVYCACLFARGPLPDRIGGGRVIALFSMQPEWPEWATRW